MDIRKAEKKDLDAIAQIYSDIHTEEESGAVTIGWQRAIYPTRATAEAALGRDDLFVMEDEGSVVGAAVINRVQVDIYEKAAWEFAAAEDEVMVLHTLVISPKAPRRGYGKAFVQFYEDYALQNGCPVLRIDTNERNVRARAMYASLGYREADCLPCVFNGLEGVHLVMLEKKRN